jgi:CTP-dependent riboflavin kinase
MPTAADDKLDSLVLDLLEWIAKKPRGYRETMEAWRTSCPRLAVWEEALDRGFVVRERMADGVQVTVTDEGLAFLRQRGRVVARIPEHASPK